MTVRFVLGLQWGDEGKGKVTDYLSDWAEVVVRTQGGANAGHTVIIEDKKYVLHLLPSGIIRPNVKCLITHGVVVDPKQLIDEIEEMRGHGVEISDRNLFLSERAHVVMPYHKLLDGAREEMDSKKGSQIGTTKRGIGPCYADKAQRIGIRVGDLYQENLRQKLEPLVAEKSAMLRYFGIGEEISVDRICDDIAEQREVIRPFVCDTYSMIREAVDSGKKILVEGAQGSLLDIDFGTYPYVTSSNCSSGGLITGSGIAPTELSSVTGVVKAYTTRVGSGPFPSEMDQATGERVRNVGKEFGATTGRPRRCGWLDVVALRYTINLSGVTDIALMKLDVLSGLETIRIAVGYKLGGKSIQTPPACTKDFEKLEVEYLDLPGWTENISGARTMNDLPENARRYVETISDLAGIPFTSVSVGPGRAQTIRLED
ncbi:MAG: adenylosuccinate synthase [Planctomycetes bacterium]|nr:adenylosuccinate synthase [Planctomycetota bacterium]